MSLTNANLTGYCNGRTSDEYVSNLEPMPEKVPNRVRPIRESMLMSKAELARRAGVSPLTIDRIERGMTCRMETKRKIILALGYDLRDKDKVFFDLGAVEK